MKHGLIVILTVALAGSGGESFAEEGKPLEGKRRVAPIRGRRVSPARAAEQRQREADAEWRRDREERTERHDRRGRDDKDDAEDE